MLHFADQDILSSTSSANALDRVRTIMRLGRALPNMLAAELKNTGLYDLGTAQIQVLLELGTQQLTFEELAEQGKFNEVCAWHTVQVLKAAGYIDIASDIDGTEVVSATIEGFKAYEILVGTASNLSVRPVLRVVPGAAQGA
ncbi:MAG: hypothetical protein O2910_04490 [Proteobacteria bacterium]|jgi:hypothetical protein|nr:hypothetical protein [Pseudomonadota bacterium]